MAKNISLQGLFEVEESESLGLLEVMRWRKVLGIDHIIFEMDAKMLSMPFTRLIATSQFLEILLLNAKS